MSEQLTPARAQASRPDPRRLVTRTKVATVVGSVAGFGAMAGLVLTNQVGVTSQAAAGSGTTGAPAAAAAGQPAATAADDFFSPPPGFSAQPPLAGGFGTQGGTSGNLGSQDGFGGVAPQGFGQGGFGGQMPVMRSGGS